MIKKGILLLTCCLMMLSTMMISCGGAEEEEVQEQEGPYGTITIASTDFGVEATDPTLFESTWSWYYCDSLIAFDENGEYVGEVAESWDLADDGVTWTFNIRRGMKFHNGDPVTAHDVLFSMERFTSEESKNPWSPGLRDNQASMRVVDDYTFEFVTKNPEPPLVDSFCWVRILPKKYFESVGEEEFRLHPMGSGPWKFVEHVPETSFKLEANIEYWRQDHVPAFQYLVDLQVPEEATQVAMLKRGEIDIPLGLTTDRRVDLENEGWRTQQQGMPAPQILAFVAPHYETAGPVHDIRIRKALSYAIDREELCETFYRGEAEPGGRFFLIPGGYGVTDDLIEPDKYDINLAKKLMDEAGYPDAWDDPIIHCFVTAGPGLDFFQAVQGYWDKVGLQVKIEVVEASVWMAYFFMPQGIEPDATNVGWIWAWTGGAFNGTYYCRNMYTSYGVHQATKDPAVDALFDQYIVELDPGKAKSLYTQWQRAAKELYTSFGIAFILPKIIVSDNIGEFTVNPHMSFMDAACGIKHPK
ncbi:MAG TPA: ABC transporter substrate-binding protein [Dehalococcoidia bacterium]|nr:ABC transporter substrate-binding protein [Dehalococcoidia bacterium]